MGDQGRWFKLWVTAPYDPHLANLSLENFARWCLFGIYLKAHGQDGIIEITSPAIALQQLFRVHTYDEMVQIIKCFPSCTFTVSTETNATVTWHNWLKYQGDYSSDRVRKFRAVKRTKKRREEKRREKIRRDNNNTPLTPLKRGYGELQNVFLTEDEYIRLEVKFNSSLRDKIEALSLYIASKGNKYKSHYATILSWDRKNNPISKEPKVSKSMQNLQNYRKRQEDKNEERRNNQDIVDIDGSVSRT